MIKTLILLICIGGSVKHAHAYSSGAPASTCDSMMPTSPMITSGTSPQTGPSNYVIQLFSRTYCSSKNVDVTLTVIGTQTFKGFLCQPRPNPSVSITDGVLIDTDTASTAQNNCGSLSSITHSNSNNKTSFRFQWRPSSTSTGTVYIVCTVVQSRFVFWNKLTSQAITYNSTACKRGFGDTCTSTADCQGIVQGICGTNGQCGCSTTSQQLSNTCSPIGLGDICSTDSNCALVNWARCNTGTRTCYCPSPYFQSGTVCVNKEIGDVCSASSDCASFLGGLCNFQVSPPVCGCQVGYRQINQGCQIIGLGEACTTDFDCQWVSSALCHASTCSCPKTFKIESNTCVMRDIGDLCSSNQECGGISGAICDTTQSTARCACPSGFNLNIKSCVQAALGSRCVRNKDCAAVRNSTCDTVSTFRCVCSTIYTQDGLTCRLRSFGDSCKTDSECSALTFAVCNGTSGVCSCKTGLRLNSNDVCEALGFGDSCRADSECSALTDAVCDGNSGVCYCKTGFKLNSSNVCEAIGESKEGSRGVSLAVVVPIMVVLSILTIVSAMFGIVFYRRQSQRKRSQDSKSNEQANTKGVEDNPGLDGEYFTIPADYENTEHNAYNTLELNNVNNLHSSGSTRGDSVKYSTIVLNDSFDTVKESSSERMQRRGSYEQPVQFGSSDISHDHELRALP